LPKKEKKELKKEKKVKKLLKKETFTLALKLNKEPFSSLFVIYSLHSMILLSMLPIYQEEKLTLELLVE